MPLELLRELANKRLPCVVEAPADVDKLRVLHAAGHISVFFLQRPQGEGSEPDVAAQVLAITDAGRDALGDGMPPGSTDRIVAGKIAKLSRIWQGVP